MKQYIVKVVETETTKVVDYKSLSLISRTYKKEDIKMSKANVSSNKQVTKVIPEAKEVTKVSTPVTVNDLAKATEINPEQIRGWLKKPVAGTIYDPKALNLSELHKQLIKRTKGEVIKETFKCPIEQLTITVSERKNAGSYQASNFVEKLEVGTGYTLHNCNRDLSVVFIGSIGEAFVFSYTDKESKVWFKAIALSQFTKGQYKIIK